MLPRQFEPGKLKAFNYNLPLYYTSLHTIEKPRDFHERYINGINTERIIEELLTRTYGADKVKWDAEKVERQAYHGLDGVADFGFDIEVIDLTSTKIDVKLDSNLKNGNVSLNLFTNYGHASLLLSGKADVSAHVYISRQKWNAVEKHLLNKPDCSFELKVLWIDLKSLRSDLNVKNNVHSLEKYTENTLPYGQRAIRFPVEFLVDRNYARLDTFTYDLHVSKA